MTYKVPTVGQLRTWVAFLNKIAADGIDLWTSGSLPGGSPHSFRVEALSLSRDKEWIYCVPSSRSALIRLRISDIHEKTFTATGIVTAAPWLLGNGGAA